MGYCNIDAKKIKPLIAITCDGIHSPLICDNSSNELKLIWMYHCL